MPDRYRVPFTCYHPDCAQDPPTVYLMEVGGSGGPSGGVKEVVLHCRRDHANIVTVPASYGRREPILGDQAPLPGGPSARPLHGRMP